MKIKFTNSATIYKINSLDIVTYGKLIQVNGNIPQNESGFILLDDEENIVNSYEDFTVVFEVGDSFVRFTNDTNVYKVYWQFNEDGFITHQLISADDYDGIVVKEGQGAEVVNTEYPVLYDEDGFYLYKVENGEIVDVTAADKAPWAEEKAAKELADAREQKKNEISSICHANILAGVELNGSRFAYDYSDQNNISNMVTLALQTGLGVPYHADGEDCRIFTRDEIVELYVAEETNVTHNTTYNNQMKAYIESLDDAAVINAIQYGQELTGIYKETYDAMMAQAQAIIDAFINHNSAE